MRTLTEPYLCDPDGYLSQAPVGTAAHWPDAKSQLNRALQCALVVFSRVPNSNLQEVLAPVFVPVLSPVSAIETDIKAGCGEGFPPALQRHNVPWSAGGRR